MKLGAVARRYLPNAYGITTSPLHASIPTDRLVAEWHLKSPRVLRAIAGKQYISGFSKKAIRITIPSNIDDLKSSRPTSAIDIQAGIRAEFTKWLGRGYLAIAVSPSASGVDYILEPGRVR
jgi:predicted GNAT superfamily acetyltransferase